MPLPVITDTLRVEVQGLTAIGSSWENVLHFRKSGALTFAGAIAVLEPNLQKLYGPSAAFAGGQRWEDPAATTWTVQRYRYTPLDGSSAATVTQHVATGQSATDALPSGVAVTFTLRTALRGRSFRGRVYWGGYSESSNPAGAEPTAATIAAQVTNWLGLITALTGTGVSLVVASYLHSTAEDVVSVDSQARWNSQRRRNR